MFTALKALETQRNFEFSGRNLNGKEMWKTVFAAILMITLTLQIAYAYSRFGHDNSRESVVSSHGPDGINDKILTGSNIHYYGRFRSGQDDVLNRYFQRFV
ncbi:unnamed protein product [Cylicocyclus nassatus]|uniref:Uncharacterized protein n=1 Tax=Cylicocyclus nassatus TaxID=53992 RepID=A0AA36DLU2_CYLNA|nr:unnamed protein product [Cylicocyclus nassatus]